MLRLNRKRLEKTFTDLEIAFPMNRRRLLAETAGVAAIPLVGCVGGGESGENEFERLDTDGKATTYYPDFSTHYILRVREDIQILPEGEVLSFDSFSDAGKIAVANAIQRDRYFPHGELEGEELRDINRHPIGFRGELFDISTGVVDHFSPPEHGPEGDPDWREPVDLGVILDDDELTVSMKNLLNSHLAMHHYEEPLFGVLTGIGEATAVLKHPSYEENESISVRHIVQTTHSPSWSTKRLEPGEVVSETYAIPPEFSLPTRIWVAVRIGDETIDLFGNRRVWLAATLDLE